MTWACENVWKYTVRRIRQQGTNNSNAFHVSLYLLHCHFCPSHHKSISWFYELSHEPNRLISSHRRTLILSATVTYYGIYNNRPRNQWHDKAMGWSSKKPSWHGFTSIGSTTVRLSLVVAPDSTPAQCVFKLYHCMGNDGATANCD